jgi:uncharacterized membrane protein
MKYAKLAYSMVLFGGVAWCSAIVLAPIFISSSGILMDAGIFLYAFFHPICHQLNARSFFIDGMPLGVCSRCSAIYFSFLIGTLIYPAVRNIGRPEIPPRWILICSCVPMFVDAFPWRFGMYEATLATRAITGSIAGFAVAFFIVPAAIQGVAELATYRLPLFNQHKCNLISSPPLISGAKKAVQ